ncbi:MAG: tetratricopeptide repeat protein [Actinoplanes sp.]
MLAAATPFIVLLTAALGAATNISTGMLPTWGWIHHQSVMWSVVAGCTVVLVALAVMQQSLSDADTIDGRAIVSSSSGVSGSEGATRPGMTSLRPPELTDLAIRGRDSLVDQLAGGYGRKAEIGSRVCVLHGMGGAGKTAVAQLLAQRLDRNGMRVWWVSAATATQLQTGMRLLAIELGATDADLRQAWSATGGAPDLVWRLLEQLSYRWLLVIDNADDTRLLAPLDEPVGAGRGWVRPVPSRNGMVLITTRDGDHGTWPTGPQGQNNGWFQMHAVGMFTPAEGAEILLAYTGPDAGTVEQATALAERLGGLPLALGIAGQTINQARSTGVDARRSTFAEYQAALTAGDLAIHSTAGVLTSRQARRMIDQTWELSLNLLDSRGLPQARTVLRLLATFADAPIPTHLLNPPSLASSPLLAGLTAEHLVVLLHALTGVGLLTLEHTHTGQGPPRAIQARLHPLIRDASRHHLYASQKHAAYLTLAVAVLENAARSDPDDPANWSVWQEIASHAAHLLTQAEEHPDTAKPTLAAAAVVTFKTATFFGSAGLYQTARDLLADLLPVQERVLGAEHPDTLSTRHSLAYWTGEAGNPQAARDLLADLLAVQEHVFGPEDPGTLTTRHDLARWTGMAGDPHSARDLCTALLSVLEGILDADDPDVLNARHDLAWWSGAAGLYQVARDLFADLLPARARVLGAEHPETLSTRHEYAFWTGMAGNPQAARDMDIALLSVRERVLGVEHPDTLSTRHNFAYWTGMAGDPFTARDLYRELLPVRGRVLGAQHPDLLSTRHNLGHWTGMAGDPQAARDLLADLLPTRERVLGAEHPGTLHTRHEHAYWTGMAGDPQAARGLLAVLLPVRERVQGEEHPGTLSTRHEHASWTGEVGDSFTARDQLAVLLPVRERVLGEEHPDTLSTRHEHASWTGEAGDPFTARDLLAGLLPVRERVQGAQHPGALLTRHELAYWTEMAARG